jgi:hypothetical protein
VWWWRRQMHAAEQALHAAEHARPVSAEAVARICYCNLLALGICVKSRISTYRLRAARFAVTIPCSPQEESFSTSPACTQRSCTESSSCTQSFCRQRFCTCVCVCVSVCLWREILYLLAAINTQHSPLFPVFTCFPSFPLATTTTHLLPAACCRALPSALCLGHTHR